MIKAGIIGATGYVGEEILRLLIQHPEVEPTILVSRSYKDEPFSSVYGNFLTICDQNCAEGEINHIAKQVDVLFIALPHGIASNQIDHSILKHTKVIDLGADYRLKSQETYEEWYKVEHGSPDLLGEAVYGLCEWKRDEIKKSSLIANPGCYTTCSILTLSPLLKENMIDERTLIVDAKSGVTGAGRGLNLGTHFTECNESIKAYKIASHRHTPEIEQQLSEVSGKEVQITFTPHLVPMNRGILVTAYAALKEKADYKELIQCYKEYYGNEFFIRLLPEGVFPETRWVKGSNYCDIGIALDKRTNRVVMLGAIDNLMKGAAGQAVQNMNILFDYPEKIGLEMVPLFPV